jgi:rhomboid family GlyGly-CTERM serine protease
MAALSLLLYFSSDASTFLQYDRTLIADGELWRIITGHFTHWSFDHFLWCTITFIALGSICERLNRKGFIISLSASAIIIPVVSWFVDPEMLFYRGLSGICSSIFIVGAVLMIQQSFADKDWANLILPSVGGILFFCKIVFEFINNQAVFVHTNNMFSPVPLAHLIGGIIGFITAAFILFRTQRQMP